MKMGQPISHTLGLDFVTILGSWNPLRIKWDFSSGPVAKTPHSEVVEAQVQSLVRELDLTCCN